MSNNRYIISLGGSIIVPDEIDVDFLREFKSVIDDAVLEGQKFLIITGGGKTARRYIDAVKDLGQLEPDDLDWLGIHSTRLNGHLLRTIFRKSAHHRIFTDTSEELVDDSVIIGAGGRPGSSTDNQAVLFAEKYNAKVVLNLSNIDYVYDKNPNEHKDAKPIEKMSWSDFRGLIGDKWDPGMNAPFDPVASNLAEKLGLQVVVMNGKPLNNLRNFLSGKPYKGTVIG